MERSCARDASNTSIASDGSMSGNSSEATVAGTLRQLNKASHKISKPISRPQHNPKSNPSAGVQSLSQQPPMQPPVYNINKNDFRDVVQRLTGSAVHHQTRPPEMDPAVPRLHKIRPPPLPLAATATVRAPPALSPLPPFPAVSAVAESPITAYMRRLRGGEQGGVGLPSPLAFGCAPPALSPGSVAYLATLSPTLLFPTSPGPLPSPRWSDH